MLGLLRGKQSMTVLMLMLLLLLQAVYTALKETESRATDVLPLWKVPALAPLIPRQRKALQAVSLIRQTTEELIAKCKDMVDAEEQVTLGLCLAYMKLCSRCCCRSCSFLPVTILAPSDPPWLPKRLPSSASYSACQSTWRTIAFDPLTPSSHFCLCSPAPGPQHLAESKSASSLTYLHAGAI